jgi:hypothetical protein
MQLLLKTLASQDKLMMVISPIKAFLEWFTSLPVGHQGYLARIFWITTTSSANEMVLSDEEYIAKFKNYLTAPDFPLRTLMKLIIVRSVFDFIFENHKLLDEITSKNNGIFFSNVISLEKKQWEKIKRTWWELKNSTLSSTVFSLWMEKIVGSDFISV